MKDYICWMEKHIHKAVNHLSVLCLQLAALLRKCSKVNKCFNSSVFNFFSSADGFCSEHGVTFEATIIDKFEVAFGTEGETLSLGCTVIIYPTVKNYQPEVVWYRDCK